MEKFNAIYVSIKYEYKYKYENKYKYQLESQVFERRTRNRIICDLLNCGEII